MNLAIESIIRTGAVQNLLKLPISIAAINYEEKPLWVTIERTGNKILVSHWDISKMVLNEFSKSKFEVKSFFIESEDLFNREKILPKDFKPIEYFHRSVQSDQNSYNKPMEKEIYESYFHDLLNNQYHKNYKRCWLWHHIVENCDFGFRRSDIKHFRRRSSSFEQYIEEEMDICRSESYGVYCEWLSIEKQLIFKEPIAGELIYASLAS